MKETTYKPARGEQCSAIGEGMAARRCGRPAVIGVQYHGDHELSQGPVWVVAWLCRQHEEHRP